MRYRSEIDGLRALAVLPVIFFHAGFSAFSGGFIGVDVFFVISGYLITGILLSDMANGTFSIARFYERRARRILPALFFVLLVCIPFAYSWMLPAQYESFSRSLIAVVLFLSNLFFWRESGYFAAEAAEKPLLHTWSLGVEEQYYVFFPLMLWVLWRMRKDYALYGIALMAIASFALCEVASRSMVSANFFLLPTRAWELLIGSLCAFTHHRHALQKHNGLSVLGLLLIVYAIVTYDEHMRLPSVYSAVPVLGTALILLFASGDAWVARLLSWRVLVAIGLISYSAYLWHHPIFAFARITSFTTPEPLTMVAFSLLSLALSAFSWQCVEQPFRNKKSRYYVRGTIALPCALVAALLILVVGMHGHLTQGNLARWKAHAAPEKVTAYSLLDAERRRDFSYDNGDCVFNMNQLTSEQESRLQQCYQKYGAGIAVIGDSHAMNLFHLMRHSRGEHQFVVGFAQGMCRPYETIPGCNFQPFQALLARQPKLFAHTIYEQAGWELFTNARGEDIDQDELSGLPLDAPVPNLTPNLAHIRAVADYLTTLTHHTRVTWLGPRIEPEISESVVVHSGCDYPFTLRPNQSSRFAALDEAITQHLAATNIQFVSQQRLMRFDMREDFMNCKETYWKDRNHYSEAGEQRFSKRITLDVLIGAP
jgi:peptidoglycan/LPS O-acetylase OafA/YrhL